MPNPFIMNSNDDLNPGKADSAQGNRNVDVLGLLQDFGSAISSAAGGATTRLEKETAARFAGSAVSGLATDVNDNCLPAVTLLASSGFTEEAMQDMNKCVENTAPAYYANPHPVQSIASDLDSSNYPAYPGALKTENSTDTDQGHLSATTATK